MTEEVLKTARAEMEGTIDAFRRVMSHVRTGRATTALLDGVHVEYYGALTPLNQVATLSVPDPTLLVIQPFDRSTLAAVEKAIQASDLGLNPQNDGKIIRVPIPPLNEERRKELVRHCRKVAEDFRVSVRNHRRDALELLKAMEKEKVIAEDDRRHAAEKVETLTKEYVERLDALLKEKEQEIMAV
jgi:ribosome recycling factor